MSRVDELTLELAAAIVDSDEYKTYMKCKEEISKNPQLFHAVNELRKHNFVLQNSIEINDMYDEVVKIFDKYAYIRTNVVANRFLRAEISLCRMVQEIQRTLLENVDFDIGFLD